VEKADAIRNAVTRRVRPGEDKSPAAEVGGIKTRPRELQGEGDRDAATPVPISTICASFVEPASIARSTRSSVSGRGMSTAGPTAKGTDQNSRSPIT